MNWFEGLLRGWTDWLTMGLSEIGWQQNDAKGREVDKILQDAAASGDAIGAQGELATGHYKMTGDQEKFLDNLLSMQNTNSARAWEQQMRDSALLSTASQLAQLGLSPGNAVSVGGMSHNGVAAADNVKTNIAMQRYQQQMQMARSMISMAGSMASSGIYGAALGTVKNTAAKIASSTAHSANLVRSPSIPKDISDKDWQDLISQI